MHVREVAVGRVVLGARRTKVHRVLASVTQKDTHYPFSPVQGFCTQLSRQYTVKGALMAKQMTNHQTPHVRPYQYPHQMRP